jgi:hypothetical protein
VRRCIGRAPWHGADATSAVVGLPSASRGLVIVRGPRKNYRIDMTVACAAECTRFASRKTIVEVRPDAGAFVQSGLRSALRLPKRSV